MPELACVNGQFVPLHQAVIPIEDRGFQFADGVYEVIGTYGGVLFAMEEHMRRLQGSLAALRIACDIERAGLRALIERGVRDCGFSEVLVYVQITRGVAPRHHEFPAPSPTPTVVMTFKELKRLPQALYDSGVSVVSTGDQRWQRCDVKSVSLLANILAKQEAHERGAFEALLVNGVGLVTEGSSTSAFCMRDGALYTAPLGPHILPSITRKILLELAGQLAIPIREEFSTLAQFKGADEAFLAGTTTEAIGIVELDGVAVGSGRPGPITRRLRAAFIELANGH